MRKFIITSLVVGLMVGISTIASANLLVNPDFETGDFTGWSAEYNLHNIGISSDNPQHGTYHARCYADTVAYQEVAITGGQQYRLTGYGNVPAGGQVEPWNSFIGLRMYNAGGGIVYNIETNLKHLERGVYHLVDTDWVTAPATAVKARLRWGTWADSPYQPASPSDFDNFDLSPIPEPSTMLLLGTGLFGLALPMIRRKK